jgi:hypothetical protein
VVARDQDDGNARGPQPGQAVERDAQRRGRGVVGVEQVARVDDRVRRQGDRAVDRLRERGGDVLLADVAPRLVDAVQLAEAEVGV